MIVIGSGPAGHRAAIQAAKIGKEVAVVEKKAVVGGVCINTGTIPSKTMREAVLYFSGFRQRGLYGASYAVKRDITIDDLMFRCNHVVRNEIDVIQAQFQRNQVDLIQGHASFLSPHGIRVEGLNGIEDYEADYFVIATGTTPARSPLIPIDDKAIIDSDTIFQIPHLPRTMTIAGGGVIGVEYACIFAMLGVSVTLVDLRSRLLEFIDAEIVEALCYHMRNIGVTLRLGEEVERVEKLDTGRVIAHLKSSKIIPSDMLFYAAGRQGNTTTLNLGAAGLCADNRGRITVNEYFQTTVPHIYAVGDVVGFPSLASVSMEQGRLATCHAFGMLCKSVPALFPYGIYTIPEISYVGQTEEELTEKGVPYEVGKAHYREIARGQILGDQTGMLKLLFHRETRELLGVHIIGEGAAELVHIGQAVLTFGGTIDYFVHNVFNYPTLAECYKVAALAGMNKLY
jgi:NAD(P) transhydrogenase